MPKPKDTDYREGTFPPQLFVGVGRVYVGDDPELKVVLDEDDDGDAQEGWITAYRQVPVQKGERRFAVYKLERYVTVKSDTHIVNEEPKA